MDDDVLFMEDEITTEEPKAFDIFACTHCGSHKIQAIVYGLLEFDTPEEEKDFNKNYVGGGCVMESDSPRWFCLSCGNTF